MEPAEDAVFPCILRILKGACFNIQDPIVLGVEVVDGIVKVGTPICIPSRGFINIGRVATIRYRMEFISHAVKNNGFAPVQISVVNTEEQPKMFGVDFDEEDELVSCISRKSIDSLKAIKDQVSLDEWILMIKLKAVFMIE